MRNTGASIVRPRTGNIAFAFLAVFLFCYGVTSQAAEDQWQGVERIVAVGDIHGDYDNFVQVLQNAGLINRRTNWTGGETHLVQLGDIPDRGPDTDKVIELMQKLERQALRDGGRVHPLIGNHEAMNIYGDLRYIHPGEFEAFRNRRSEQVRENFYQRSVEQLIANQPDFVPDANFKADFESKYPLGFVEHRLAWSTQGDIGSWVATHNTVIKINRTLFLHGGISREFLGMSITEINDQVRSELQGNLPEEPGVSESELGPLWYRGLATGDETMESTLVDEILDFYDVDHVVIGHTPGAGTVVPRFGGKVLVADTGISDYYGAHLGSLVIENGELTNVQRGEPLKIPTGEEPLLPYLEAAAELEPGTPGLQEIIDGILQTP